MRLIEYRGIRVDNGEWVYGFYYHNGEVHGRHLIILQGIETEWVEIKPETLGEFTGETDRRNTKLYEGDVYWSAGETYTVEFHDGCFCCVTPNSIAKELLWVIVGEKNSELIGNIHEK